VAGVTETQLSKNETTSKTDQTATALDDVVNTAVTPPIKSRRRAQSA